MSLDVALVSCRHLPEPDPDAAPLATALTAAGLSSHVMAWDDPEVDWAAARLTVLRSCWNYPQHASAFMAWAEATAAVTTLLNPLPVLLWNIHKHYLLDLESHGIPVTPTVLVPRNSRTTLAEIRKEHGWQDVVVKPAVSAASFRTTLVTPDQGAAGEEHLRGLVAERDTLVQAYLPSVEEYGERALIWVQGQLTHAIRKTPRLSGQDEAVSSEAVPVAEEEAELARKVMAALDAIIPSPEAGTPILDRLLYGRVDVAPGPDGSPMVMELELMEPSLFFNQGPVALERFVAGLEDRLNRPR